MNTEDERAVSIPYFVHEGEIMRQERTIRRLCIVIMVIAVTDMIGKLRR